MDRRAPGRTLATIGRALRAGAQKVLRVPGAIGSGIAGSWRGLSTVARRRLAAAAGTVVVIVLFLTLAVPNLPCEVPGGEACPPPDDAQALVPADALAYLHANLDPEEEEYELALEVGERIPLLSGQLVDRALAQLPGPLGSRLSFEDDIRPWFGGEAAVAILPGAPRPERVVLLEVEDAEGAEDFAGVISVGVGSSEEVAGAEVSVDRAGLATAQSDGFLLIGSRAGIGEALDAAAGTEEATSLADDELATEVREQLPEHRFAEVYLSADGVTELIAGDRGTLGSLTPLLAPGATRGAAAALTATEDPGLELAVRSELDPELARSQPGFFAAFPSFEPSLPERLSQDALAYVGIGEPRSAVGALLDQAGEQAPGIAAGFESLGRTLRRAGEIDIEADLLDALGDEAAFALEPQAGDLGPGLPFVEFIAAEVDEDAARRALAAIQGPLADSVNPGNAGQAPVFGEEEIEGVQARSLRISPTVELTYAVFDELAAVATDPAGIGRIATEEDGLDDSELYERATEDFEDELSLIAYLDLGELVALGEQLGLAEDPLYATFAGQFRQLDALGVAVRADDEALATDARLLFGDEEPAADDAAPVPVPSD